MTRMPAKQVARFLMQEHDEHLDSAVLTSAATIVRRFVEDDHERLEEQSVLPRVQKARREGAR